MIYIRNKFLIIFGNTFLLEKNDNGREGEGWGEMGRDGEGWRGMGRMGRDGEDGEGW